MVNTDFCDALGQFVGNIHGSTKKVLKIQISFSLMTSWGQVFEPANLQSW